MRKSKRQLEKQLASVSNQVDKLEARKIEILTAIFALKGRCYLCETNLHDVEECRTFAGTCSRCKGRFQTINPEKKLCLVCDFTVNATTPEVVSRES